MAAVNHGFYWSKSPLHPSDSLKAHVKGHQRRVPACRLTSSSAAGRLKRRDLIKSRRFYRTSRWTCADPSTLRLRSTMQLEGKTENRIQCEKTQKKHSFTFFTRRGNSWSTPGVSCDMFSTDICLWTHHCCSFPAAGEGRHNSVLNSVQSLSQLDHHSTYIINTENSFTDPVHYTLQTTTPLISPVIVTDMSGAWNYSRTGLGNTKLVHAAARELTRHCTPAKPVLFETDDRRIKNKPEDLHKSGTFTCMIIKLTYIVVFPCSVLFSCVFLNRMILNDIMQSIKQVLNKYHY